MCEEKQGRKPAKNHVHHIDRHSENYTTVYSIIQYTLYTRLYTDREVAGERECVTERT
jgi:hypothetical protein